MNDKLQREILRYEPHFVDLRNFTLIAEYKDSELTFFNFDIVDGECDIYAIQVDDDLYVGSTATLKTRIKSHVSDLRKGKHHSKRFQEVWNEKHRFKVYRIMRCYDRGTTLPEDLIVRLLQPSMNTIAVTKEGNIQEEVVWTYETDYDRKQHHDNDAALICPNCQTLLRITLSANTNRNAKTRLR